MSDEFQNTEPTGYIHEPSRSVSTFIDIGAKLFKLRDYTPIPLIIVLLFTAEPNVASATLGIVLCMFGELFRIYSVAFIGSVSRTRNTSTTGGALVTEGPFSWVRNPLYVGNFFIAFGIAVFGSVSWVVLLTIVLFGFQYYAIVKYEEKLLVSKFGGEYELYRERVPAWIPRKLPRLDSWNWPTTFTPAIRSERRTLAAIVIMIVALVLLA